MTRRSEGLQRDLAEANPEAHVARQEEQSEAMLEQDADGDS